MKEKKDIVLRKLKKYYEDKIVLDIDNLVFESGKSYAILGENGSGKSTLLGFLSGVLKVEEGTITGRDEYYKGFMPQTPDIFDYSVFENVSLCLRNEKKEQTERKVRNILESVGLLGFEQQRAVSLSGGESQRLAIARLLVNDYDLLLLDEPSSATDIIGRDKIETALLNYKKEKQCMLIFSSHSPGQARKMADEIIFLHNGRVIGQGATEEILYHSENKYIRGYMEHWTL